jgi:hypothetical protein
MKITLGKLRNLIKEVVLAESYPTWDKSTRKQQIEPEPEYSDLYDEEGYDYMDDDIVEPPLENPPLDGEVSPEEPASPYEDMDPPTRIPLKGGDEVDALTGWKNMLKWKPGQRAAAKNSYNRRLRRAG